MPGTKLRSHFTSLVSLPRYTVGMTHHQTQNLHAKMFEYLPGVPLSQTAGRSNTIQTYTGKWSNNRVFVKTPQGIQA
ncbi:hypothetical protein EYC84_003855 [Monilinia fructicola]|uniref:Uncharacterized protein n=1 Tax=Monilinia fructicola TaxID=38448 RepID=A0A5M9JZS4_MONFR|nr:hypothetical protein EYC84_003855 [Monilinia fructicola]